MPNLVRFQKLNKFQPWLALEWETTDKVQGSHANVLNDTLPLFDFCLKNHTESPKVGSELTTLSTTETLNR